MPAQDASSAAKILITTIGKVGSSTLRDFFSANQHKVLADGPSCNWAELSDPGAKAVVHTHNLRFSAFIANELAKTGQDVIVFVGARDMLKRHVSAMFENLNDRKNPHWYCPAFGGMSSEERSAFFERNLFRHCESVAHRWLHGFTKFHETHPLGGARLAQLRSRGFCVLGGDANPRIRFCFYRVEDLGRCWEGVMEELDIRPAKQRELRAKNVARDKPVGSAYERFLREYTPSQAAIEAAYGCDLSVFYGAEELAAQKAHWSRKAMLAPA